MPEVSQVQTVAEDIVDLTIKAEQPEAEESAEMVLQKVGEAPKILVKPEPKVVQEGQTVVFECEMSGEPVPEVEYGCHL